MLKLKAVALAGNRKCFLSILPSPNVATLQLSDDLPLVPLGPGAAGTPGAAGGIGAGAGASAGAGAGLDC